MNPISDNPNVFIRDDNVIYIHGIPSSKRNQQNKEKEIPTHFDHNHPPNNYAKKNTRIYKIILVLHYNSNPSKNLNSNPSSNDNTGPQPKPNALLLFLMKKQKIKEIPLTKIINSSLLDLPSPSSISFL
jgi:hypothetical protein